MDIFLSGKLPAAGACERLLYEVAHHDGVTVTPVMCRAGKCPSWVTDYAAFHRKTRGTKDAKYLVHSCHKVRRCLLLAFPASGHQWPQGAQAS